MRRLTGRAVSRLATVSLAATAVVTLVTPGAGVAAPANDDFALATAGPCPQDDFLPYEGFVQFEDNGPGAEGGGDNDDYLIVGDSCPNGDGVKAWAWVDGVLKGDKYNGKGAYKNVIWDPLGNLKNGQSLGVKICSVNGNSGTPYHCQSVTRTVHE
jgi:hypothetical protein